jgi:hypothetical protein
MMVAHDGALDPAWQTEIADSLRCSMDGGPTWHWAVGAMAERATRRKRRTPSDRSAERGRTRIRIQSALGRTSRAPCPAPSSSIHLQCEVRLNDRGERDNSMACLILATVYLFSGRRRGLRGRRSRDGICRSPCDRPAAIDGCGRRCTVATRWPWGERRDEDRVSSTHAHYGLSVTPLTGPRVATPCTAVARSIRYGYST